MDLIETAAVRKHCRARSIDRAAFVSIAILQGKGMAAEQREAIAAYLRDEFSDIARNAINEAPAMIAPLNQIAPRLKKLLLMLSPERDGEIVNAAHLIGTTLRGAGADWHDLVTGLLTPARAATQSAHDRNDRNLDWHAMREFYLQHLHLLRPCEHEFIASLGDWRSPLTEAIGG
jgi:hypothetical protein